MTPAANATTSLLLALAVLGPTAFGARAAFRRHGVVVDHVVIFSFGFLFYWVLPVAAGSLRILADEPVLALWYGTWAAAERSGGLLVFLGSALAAYLAFVGGDAIGGRIRLRPERGTLAALPHDARLFALFLLPLGAIAAAYAWALRGELFTGYRTVYEADTTRGTFTAVNVLLLGLCFLRWAERDRWPTPFRGWRAVVADPFMVAYVVSAVLVLSLGGRLYILSAALMALTWHSVYRRALPTGRALLIPIAGALVAGTVGTMRLGYAPSPAGVTLNVLAEPLFTSFSLLHFIAQGDIPLVALPRFLLSDFVNLVPTAVLPMKAQLIADPEQYGYEVFSPGGALSSFFSWAINFGALGLVPMHFGIGWALAVLKRRTAPHLRVRYCMLSGWLAFTFFRDAFSISLVKSMFEFSILVPWLIVLSCHVMTVVAPRKVAPA